jgi:hypothetical protein
VRKGGRKYQLGIQEKYQPARATEAKSLNRWRPRQESEGPAASMICRD